MGGRSCLRVRGCHVDSPARGVPLWCIGLRVRLEQSRRAHNCDREKDPMATGVSVRGRLVLMREVHCSCARADSRQTLHCISDRPETVKHAMEIFARLVQVLLGMSAVARRKLDCGQQLVILGMLVSPGKEGVKFTVSGEKVLKWLELLDRAIRTEFLDSGSAQKLAGR